MPRDPADPHADPYTVLGVPPSASAEQIKAAYRRQAMALHPDRNPGRDTTHAFQRLTQAYAQLTEPQPRARASGGPPPGTTASVVPVACSRCGKVSAQPRVVVFRAVKSLLLVTYRRTISGVFCSDCARRQALKASASTWLLGWWSVPWGPLYTVQALAVNLLGGHYPALDNARLLGHQARYFHASGRPDLAALLAEQALQFCRKVPRAIGRERSQAQEKQVLTEQLQALLAQLGTRDDARRLKSSWGWLHPRFFIQLGALLALVAGLGVALVEVPGLQRWLPWAAAPFTSQVPPGAALDTPRYLRPANAPNGQPWPTHADYLSGEPRSHDAGLSQVVIDNTANRADVLVLLMALQGPDLQIARQVFIPAGEHFTLEGVSPGLYHLRYRDLASGAWALSGQLQLQQTATARGTQYSIVTVALTQSAAPPAQQPAETGASQPR